MTILDKLKVLEKAWGYLEISQATIRISGRRIWLVKNYKGKPISEVPDEGLPGNPFASKRQEYSGHTQQRAILSAYTSFSRRRRKLEGRENAA